jgi:hypothetical protein
MYYQFFERILGALQAAKERYLTYQWFDQQFRLDRLDRLAAPGFIRKAPIILFSIPVVYRMFPTEPYLMLDVDWIKVSNELRFIASTKLQFYIRMPFSLMLIYFSALVFALGLIIYEMTRPRFVSRRDSVARGESVMHDFRQIAFDLPARQSSYFFVHLLEDCASNYAELRDMTDEQIAAARANDLTFKHLEKLFPKDSPLKMNKDSLWYDAREMKAKESRYDAFEEALAWWINYTYRNWRWACGILYGIAIILSIALLVQGTAWLFK